MEIDLWMRHFPVLLCNTKLAQSTSQFYFALQTLSQSTSQYYFVVDDLHKVLGSTTELAQNNPQYYFVLQSLQSTSRCYFLLHSLHKSLPTCKNHAAITMPFATKASKAPCNCEAQKRTKHIEPALPFHRRLQPLYGFLPKTSPMQHSCSHYHAFCSTTHTFMQPLHCDWHPHVAKNQGRTDYALKRSKPHPPHTGGTFHRRLQPLYTEKQKVSCSGFLPNTTPMRHACSHHNHPPKPPHSLRHHFPRSPHSLRHHFPRSPHSLRDHFPRSPHSLHRHFPKSPLPFVTTYPTHHFHHPSSCTVV